MRFWISVCVIAAMLNCAASAAELSGEARQCFEWFSTLGYPDVKDAPWAEVCTGGYSEKSHMIDTVGTAPGFVLRDTKDDLRLLKLDLTQETLVKTAEKSPGYHPVAFKERPFFEMARNALQSPTQLRSPYGSRLEFDAQVFVLAFASWRKGNTGLAQKLFDDAAKLARIPRNQHVRDAESPSLRQELERELGFAAMWDAMLRFGGSGFTWNERDGAGTLAPRGELLQRFRVIVRSYPSSPLLKRAQEMALILERMVEEDQRHKIVTPDELANLPIKKQIEELIFRLRDQHGHQYMEPGSCNIFDGCPDGTSPAHQLVEIGYPAVPQLLEAVTDDRFSRSVGFYHRADPSNVVLTVGDCAAAVLDRIAGNPEQAPSRASERMSRAEAVAARRQAMENWWKEVRAKGNP